MLKKEELLPLVDASQLPDDLKSPGAVTVGGTVNLAPAPAPVPDVPVNRRHPKNISIFYHSLLELKERRNAIADFFNNFYYF
jgi:hypothetical protein